MIQLRPMVRIQDLHPKTHDLRISLVIEKKKDEIFFLQVVCTWSKHQNPWEIIQIFIPDPG